MKRKYKVYLKLNFISIFFIAVSFISITLAWFAYSGLARAETNIDVKAWHIEFQKDNKPISNDIVISVDEIYPGMETVSEKIDIKNLGDSNAFINYSITSARILNEEINIDESNEDLLIDKLSHDYPFHINIGLTKPFAEKESGESELNVSISWPLDSANDKLDSEWGNNAFQFKQGEEEKYSKDSNYQIRNPLKITINVKVEQFIESDNSLDLNFPLGKTILYNPTLNTTCDKLSDTCLKTYVIDTRNRQNDTSVTLLPDLYKSYSSGTYEEKNEYLTNIRNSWQTTVEELSLEKMLDIISLDVVNTKLFREGLSDSTLGYMKLPSRISESIAKAKERNGHFTFSNKIFPFLSSSTCSWLSDSFDNSRAFATIKNDDEFTKIFAENKTSTCNIIPVLKVSKANLTGTI